MHVGDARQVQVDNPQLITIGIGAGSGTAGQVLVLHDMLGIHLGKPAKFVRNFMAGADGIEAGLRSFVHAVKDGSFPEDGVHAW